MSKETKTQEKPNDDFVRVRVRKSEFKTLKLDAKDKKNKECETLLRKHLGLDEIKKQTKLQQLREKHGLDSKATYKDIVEYLETKGE